MKALLFGNKILQGSTLKFKRGVATLEILIAFAILMLSMTAVIIVVFQNQNISVDTQTNTEATAKAQALLEATRALSYQSFDSVVPAASKDGIYQKSVDVVSVDADTKRVTGSVTWGFAGRSFVVALTTLLTNAVASCSATVRGDWTAPKIYGYVDIASAAGATSVAIQGSTAYITSNPNSSTSDDFYIADVSGAAPEGASVPIVGHFSTGYGLTDVRVAGMYAFVAADSTISQLLVVDVQNPELLSAGSIKAKLDVTAQGDHAVGNTLFYSNKKIYLGLSISSDTEFHIFDVSNPTAPFEIGTGYEVGATINRIVVKNNIAYLTTAAHAQVIALNVSDPANPTLVGAYTSATLTGQSVVLDTNATLYLGRIGGNGNPKLLAFDIANLSAPTWSMPMGSQSGVYTLILRGNLLFMTTADSGDGLQIWDVARANASVPPTRYDTAPLNIQQASVANAVCAGNVLYIAQHNKRAMQIVGPSL